MGQARQRKLSRRLGLDGSPGPVKEVPQSEFDESDLEGLLPKRPGVAKVSSSSKPSREVDSSRGRINLSLTPEVKSAVQIYAQALGMTESQLVLHALLLALPRINDLVGTVLRGRSFGDVDHV